jgi:hypothetical protein
MFSNFDHAQVGKAMSNQIGVKREWVSMELSQPEIKLILRLRQLRKMSGPTPVCLVTVQPLALCALGQQIEALEMPITSGSGGMY